MHSPRVPLKKRRLSLFRVLVLLVGLALPILIAVTMNNTRANTREVELRHVQVAVQTMMAHNGISTVPHPVTSPTNDMSAFPDMLTSPKEKGLLEADKPGYVLYGHDLVRDGDSEAVYSYVNFATTQWYYSVASDGTVFQSSPQ